MTLHKLLIDDFYDDSFLLIAIHSRLEDYRLAYFLNQHFKLQLHRRDEDLDFNYLTSAYSIFDYDDQTRGVHWNLVSNVCKKEEEHLQSSGSLFDTSTKMLKTYYLLPEFKKVDYLIKISNEDEYLNDKEILKVLQSIPQIITCYYIDVDQVKSKDNLIFDVCKSEKKLR